MQRFKRHARLLAEQMGGAISYGHDESFKVDFTSHAIHFEPSTDDRMMTCHCELQNGSTFVFSASQNCIFDIIDRFARDHLRESLRDYDPPDLLELSDYINEEDAELEIQQLRDRIAAEPELHYAELGGNCIFVEYVGGALIIRDELLRWATNVVEI